MCTLQRCVSSQLLKLLLFTVALALIQQVKICFLKLPAARDCHQDWSCFLKSFSEMVEIKQSGKYFKCFWRSKASYEQQQEHYVTQDLATSLLEKTVTGHHYIQTLKELLNLHNSVDYC